MAWTGILVTTAGIVVAIGRWAMTRPQWWLVWLCVVVVAPLGGLAAFIFARSTEGLSLALGQAKGAGWGTGVAVGIVAGLTVYLEQRQAEWKDAVGHIEWAGGKLPRRPKGWKPPKRPADV